MPVTDALIVADELWQLNRLLAEARAKGEVYSVGFLEGRGFQLTRGMDEHPKWWSNPCQCNLCISYGE